MVPLHILEDKEATVASITTTASALRPPAAFYYIYILGIQSGAKWFLI